MYAWYELFGFENSFFDYNRPKTYGDDLLNSVKPEFADRWNNCVYARCVRDFYGMEYTSASKSLELEEFVTPDRMTFLKRSFVYSDIFGKYVAPLDMNSIMKALQWSIPSNYVSECDQMISSASSVLRELVFCSTEKQFSSIREGICNQIVQEFGIEREAVYDALPPFKSIVNDLLSNTMVGEEPPFVDSTHGDNN